ncbi:MAG TPA: Uma2 family endonuclease [Isosphaeraceae bacterium]|jgi:Uma2 family endonuclease
MPDDRLAPGIAPPPARPPRKPRGPFNPTPLTLEFRPVLELTDELFTQICAANSEMRLERTAQGALEIMPPAGSDTGWKNSKLTGRLHIWAEADGTGVLFDSSAGFTLPNGAIRSPDASWIARDRWDALTPELRAKFAPICPDFVVELRSPSDRKRTIRSKMREYIRQGARLGWLIDRSDETVEVYRPGRPVETRARPATLDGEDVLPGLVLDLKGILFD